MPGMGPGIGGGRRKPKQSAKKSKAKRGSGNPAKRAQAERAAREKQQTPAANPFGLPDGNGAGDDGAAQDFSLPPEFSKYLPKQ
jgi:signal recognition particle subunit SRP54